MRFRAESPTSPRSWRTIVRLPIFLLANVALLLVIGASTVRETYRGWTVDREIGALEAQAMELEGRKTQLERLAQDLISPDRVEYDARARLGRALPGERVIVLQGYSATATWDAASPAVAERTSLASGRASSNPARWWAYFFHQPSL
ncbi:septum formation initiator family protein [Candidatus Uhrbacteria bacterium]|nr:septum formation initiator family protein [Candidatus Uhrbacteria bacterium]